MRILLVGSGRSAYFLARRFGAHGSRVTVVVDAPDQAQRLSRALGATPVVVGDGSRPEVLDDAGALGADALVAFTTDDHRNLIACQVARRSFSVRRTIALVNDPENREAFGRLGVDAAVSITELLAGMLMRETVFDELRGHEAFADGQVLVSEVELSRSSPACGHRLADFGAPLGLVAAVLRNGSTFVPSGESRLQAGDRLVVIAAAQNHDAYLKLLLGDTP